MYGWHAAELFRVLASERRLRALCLIAGAGPSGMSLEQLALREGISERSAGRIVERLGAVGLVAQTRRRRTVLYRAASGPIDELLAFLDRRLSRRAGAVASPPPKAKPYRSLAAKLGRTSGGEAVASLAAATAARPDRKRLTERLAAAA